MRYLLDLFADLSVARQPGFSAPAPLTWTEIGSWAALTGIRLETWEVRVLRALDACYLVAWQDARPEQPSKR